MSKPLTKPQREALEKIGDKERIRDLRNGTIKALLRRELISIEHQETPYTRWGRVRITDAGRVALGDWAAGEER